MIRLDVVLLSRIAEKCSVVQKDWISFHRDVRAQLILFNHLFKNANPQNKMTLIKFCTEVVKILLGYEKLSQIKRRGSNNAHYPKLIPVSEKKKNTTLPSKRCYKNGQRHETRYQCVLCEDKPPLCVDPCFMLSHENQWTLFTVFTDYLQYCKVFYFRV